MSRPGPMTTTMTDSLNSLRDQLAQLKAQHDAGKIGASAYAKARTRLERQIVEHVTSGAHAPAALEAAPRAGKGLWLATLAATVVIAAGGYAWTGSPSLIGADTRAAAAGNGGSHEVTREQIATMAERLAARLKEQPDDAEGWLMLGRSYMVLDQPEQAVTAYERVAKLRPDDAAALTDYADALAMKNGRDLAGEPLKLIERALKIEPGNLKALMLAGTAAFNRQDYATAVSYWDRMPQFGPPDDPLVQSAAAGAAEARRRGNLPPAAGAPAMAAAPAMPAAPAAQAAPSLINGPGLTGTVTLAPALKSQASPEDAVFVFARAAEGSRMPLALVRVQVKDLPYEFRLDDSQAMSPAAKLSGADRVVVGARISKSGQAMPQPGDLEGLSAPVAPSASGVKVEIAGAIK